MKVSYIAGWGRSGSTILGRVLNEVDGVVLVGELCFAWDRGVLFNSRCSCGAPFHDCDFWRGVFDEAFGGMDPALARRTFDQLNRFTRTRQLPRLMLGAMPTRREQKEWRELLATLTRLYRVVRQRARSRVVVDSSKLPGYAYLLHAAPEIDLSVVHLVRDPRAVAFSWAKRKRYDGNDGHWGGLMSRKPPLNSAAFWLAWNYATERLFRRPGRPYLLMRYEDFVRAPRTHVKDVLSLAGEGDRALPFVDDRTVVLGENHAVAGNPLRFSTGRVVLRPDREWAERMPPRDRRLVGLLTLPLLRRYGYDRSGAVSREG